MKNTSSIAIGFAKQFFTLWNVSGDEYRTEYQYVKNISKDENVVKELYPNVEIDYTLSGGTWIVRETPRYVEQHKSDEFQRGKYSGMKIAECDDYKYMEWYFDMCASQNERELIFAVLEKVGYRIITSTSFYDGYEHEHNVLIDPETAQMHDERERKFKETIEHIQNNGEIEVTITSNASYNIDENNYTLSTDNDSVYIIVNEAKSQYYNGYEYFLPVIDGKARRVKNKTFKFKVKEYEIVGYNIFVKI